MPHRLELTTSEYRAALALKDAGMTVPDPEELRLMEAVIEAIEAYSVAVKRLADYITRVERKPDTTARLRVAKREQWRKLTAALTAYRERGK